MLTKLKISSLIAFALVLLVYVSSPWWAVYFAKHQLPSDVSDFQAKIDYPGLKNINIQSAQFELASAGLQVKLSELVADYSLSEITIESISISRAMIDESNLDNAIQQPEPSLNSLAVLFELINLIFKQVGVIEGIHNLKIQQLIYSGAINELNRLTIENLSLAQADGKLQISSPWLQLSTSNFNSVLPDKLNQPSSINLTFELSEQQLVASWQHQNSTITSLQYAKDLNQEIIQLSISSELLEQIILNAGLAGVAFKSDLQSVEINKTITTNQLQFNFDSELTVNQQSLNRWLRVADQGKDQDGLKNSFRVLNDIQSKIDFKLQLGDKDFCAAETNCNLSMAASFQTPLDLEYAGSRIGANNAKFLFESNFTFEALDSLDTLFEFSHSLARLEVERFSWLKGDAQHRTEKDKESSATESEKPSLELTGFEIKLQPSIPQTRLVKLFEGPWTLAANASAKSVNAMLLSSNVKRKNKEGKNDRVKLQAESGLTAAFNLINQESLTSSGSLSIPQFDLDARFGSAKADGKITWQGLNQNLTLGSAQAEIKLTTPKVSDFSFDKALIKANMQTSNNTLDGSIDFWFNEIPMSPIEFKYSKNDQSTELLFAKQEVNLEVVNHLLSFVGEQQKIPLQILSGSLTHSGDVLLAKSALLSSQLDADKITVLFGENKVVGLKMQQLVTSIAPKIFQSSLEIESIDFSSGLQISDIHASIDGRSMDNQEHLEFKNISANILAGQLSSNSLLFSDLELQPSKIKLSALSLTKLIEFIDVAGLQAEGSIDFDLPISSSNDQLVVKDGKFQSIGKGIIKYSTGSEQTQSEKNIVFQALENFHFESFDGDISYDEGGQYLIKLHLLGANPAFYDGYPIDFTLNLNGQLTGVFRSLFLTGNFEQAVLDQVEAQKLNTNNQL